jgi:hypothetical protein
VFFVGASLAVMPVFNCDPITDLNACRRRDPQITR